MEDPPHILVCPTRYLFCLLWFKTKSELDPEHTRVHGGKVCLSNLGPLRVEGAQSLGRDQKLDDLPARVSVQERFYKFKTIRDIEDNIWESLQQECRGAQANLENHQPGGGWGHGHGCAVVNAVDNGKGCQHGPKRVIVDRGSPAPVSSRTTAAANGILQWHSRNGGQIITISEQAPTSQKWGSCFQWRLWAGCRHAWHWARDRPAGVSTPWLMISVTRHSCESFPTSTMSAATDTATYLLKFLWAMIAWLFLGDVWDHHTPYFSSKLSFLCHNFTPGQFRAEKTMFRPPGDDSQAARMPWGVCTASSTSDMGSSMS